jgi:dienelactone hydrolase
MTVAGSRSRNFVRWSIAVAAACAALAVASPADAAITSVFTNTAAPIPCAVQGSGVRLCDQTIAGNPGGTARSTVKTFDGVPIDVRVAFPPEPPSGPDGGYPLIMLFHGYAGSKLSLANMTPFLNAGYATFSMTTRGFGQSCGTSTARSADPTGCAAGYVRLMDTRYEVRDAQELAGLLTDEGRTSPTQIGAIGGSYGGGMSMALGALKNRKMLPDGSLAAWQSPNGTPMQIAAATPEIPWTDLPYSLLPNGSTLDYVADAPYQGRTGVLKSSWENALYNSGAAFFYAPAGTDPDADLPNWHTLFNAGEPYDDAGGNPLPAAADIRDELTTHHSSYYIDHSQAPAPLLISSGFTDDLFPADEAIRFYNRTRSEHPTADISLFFGSFGHQRGQNKPDAVGARSAAELAWFNHYVRGIGSTPHEQRDRLGEPEHRPAVEPHEPLARQLELGREDRAVRRAVQAVHLRVREDRRVEPDCLLQVVVEPQERRDGRHVGAPLRAGARRL